MNGKRLVIRNNTHTHTHPPTKFHLNMQLHQLFSLPLSLFLETLSLSSFDAHVTCRAFLSNLSMIIDRRLIIKYVMIKLAWIDEEIGEMLYIFAASRVKYTPLPCSTITQRRRLKNLSVFFNICGVFSLCCQPLFFFIKTLIKDIFLIKQYTVVVV